MVDSKKIQIFAKCLVVLAFIAFSYRYIIKPYYDEKNFFFRSEYVGIIRAIEKRPGHRDVPHILLNDEWKLLNSNEIEIATYIEPGDSIVKFKNSSSIFIYRWNMEGDLIKKEFK